jgi:hypothetical protein
METQSVFIKKRKESGFSTVSANEESYLSIHESRIFIARGTVSSFG